MILLFFIGLLVLSLWLMVRSVTWVLRPITSAARDLHQPAQFSMADFFCLFVLVHLSMAAAHGIFPAEIGRMIWIVDAFGWFASGSLWWVGGQTLSRAGVTRPWPRVGVLTVVLPLTLVGAMAIPILILCSPLAIVHANSREGRWTAALLAAVGVVVCGTFFGLSRFTRYLMAQLPSPVPDQSCVLDADLVTATSADDGETGREKAQKSQDRTSLDEQHG